MMAIPKVAIFFGTRPEAIKMAPVVDAFLRDGRFEVLAVSSGQHREMLKQVIDVFQIPVHRDLDVMLPNQSLAELSSRLMSRIDALLQADSPDLALVQGDTTTVLMAALACFYRQIPVGHVEAGLRTGNMRSPFPEEANRKLATPLCTLHFAPTHVNEQNLLRESIDRKSIFVTGNTVIDALQMEVRRQTDPAIKDRVETELQHLLPADWRAVPFVLVTGHRRENFGSGFQAICEALSELAENFPKHRFIYPVHLNPNVREVVHASLSQHANICLLPPLSYRPFVALLQACRLVLTDSGGVQEEAPGLGKPVLVMRDTTERPEGIEAGTVRLVGAERRAIVDGVRQLLTDERAYRQMAEAVNPYGDGRAAARIVTAVANHFRLPALPSSTET